MKEILLVDDFSDKHDLKSELDSFIKKGFSSKIVNIIRNRERKGIIQSRTEAGYYASGDVIIFMDSHCEVYFDTKISVLSKQE